MKIDCVIFDLDGVLLDTTEGIIESVLHTVNHLGLDELPYDTLLKFIGPPVQQSFMKCYGCNREDAQVAADYFREYYKRFALLKAKPYEGIYKLCSELKNSGVSMAVATYKREDYALELLHHFEFDKYFAVMHGSDNLNLLSKADIVNLCITEMGGQNEGCVLIGDTEHDAIGAKNAGVNFIGVTYGFGFSNKDSVENYPNIGIADNPLEIFDIIREYIG